MKIIDNEMIKSLNFEKLDYYKWAKEVFLCKKRCLLPPKISMKEENHIFFNVMPSIIKDLNVAGVKVVSRFPKRIPSLDSQILLYDSKTGENLALMDANIITAYRTGAVASLAINTLAVKNYKTIAILGLGNVARATMNILLETLENRKITIKVFKYKSDAEDFVQYYSEYNSINFIIVDNYKDLIENSDVIISGVTSTDINFGEDEWFKEGCLVVPIHTLGFQNCDLFFDKFIVDDVGHVRDFKYFNQFKEVHELSEVLKKKSLGRNNNKQRIMAYNIGNSIFDVFYAKKIYDIIQAQEKKVLNIDLKSPKEKKWV